MPTIKRFLAATPDVELIWLSDGVDLGDGADFVNGLAGTIDKNPITVVEGGIAPAHALAAADNAAAALGVKVLRATTGSAETGTLRGLDLKGLPLGEASFAFKPGDREADAEFDLPVEIRNDIARIEIANERSAGAVQLLDKRWRRRTVGVVSGASTDTAQPLLASTYYLSRALNPFADVRLADTISPTEAVGHFLEQKLPMMILADVGNVAGETHDKLARWIEDGGVLVRFAGPRLAAADDDLVPVKLRRGGRILGGSLSWDKPQPLTGFSRGSPFDGMAVPNDVTVTRQVLAEPDSTLTEHTWATLADGTPLVTAARRGKGMIVLFHVTGDTRWSDLPLSGAFVDMLKRIVSLAGATAAADTENTDTQTDTQNVREVVPPSRVLDGFGSFEAPPATARPVPAGFTGRATAEHPPGFYGPPEGLLAVNTLAPADRLSPLDFAPLKASREVYRRVEPQDLRGPIFLAALALLVLDALVVFWLAGGLRRLAPRRRAPASAAVVMVIAAAALAFTVSHAAAQDADVPKSALETKLAYVVTGDSEVDTISKAGLQGLTLFLAQRTALEAGEPIGLDLARDELAFYPLIYWPIVPGVAKPSEDGAQASRHLHEGRRHGAVRYPRRRRRSARPGRRNQQPRHGRAAHHPRLARHSGARAGAARPRADQDILPAARLPRPLQHRPALGRGAADRESGRSVEPPGARERRRVLDPHHLERPRRRLGAARRRPADAADGARRAAPARIRLPRRRQHRDVHAHRQLQGRPGARAGAARTAGAVGGRIELRCLVRAARPCHDPVGGARCCDRGVDRAACRAQPRRASCAPSRWRCCFSRCSIRR